MIWSRIVPWALAGLLGLSLPAPAEEPAWRPFDPTLVAKGPDYLLHYLPAAGLVGFGQFHTPPSGGTEAAFLHTTPSTGRMKVLMRLPGNQFTVLGYVADRERFYLALRSQVVRHAPGSGQPLAPEVRYHVYAFWMADGRELVHTDWKEADVPEKLRAGKAAAEGGPIRLADGGFRCFDVTYKFDGKTVVAPAPKGK